MVMVVVMVVVMVMVLASTLSFSKILRGIMGIRSW